MKIGYARVSTEDQNLDLQTQALKLAGCARIYTDPGVSGSASSRPGLNRALARIKAGDTLVVWRLDRLGRSLPHLVRLLETFSRRGIAFHSVTEHINTHSSGGRLMFHMMAALAEFERTLISERTRAGIDAARARGASIGRQPLLSSSQTRTALELVRAGTYSEKEMAEKLGVHRRTLQRAFMRNAACADGLSSPGVLS